MIFQKSSEVPYETTGGLESVAVRMPNHPVALALIQAGGGYIAAPSAQIHQEDPVLQKQSMLQRI